MWTKPQDEFEIAIANLLRRRLSNWERLKYDLSMKLNDRGISFALFLGLLTGVCLSSTAIALANGLDVAPVVVAGRLPDLRSVMSVLTILQAMCVFSLACLLPNRPEIENPGHHETRPYYQPMVNFYHRMPLDPARVLSELCRCSVGKNLIVGSCVALITCYVHTMVLFHGWGWEPVVLGTVAGAVQTLMFWHLFCATWMFAVPATASLASAVAMTAKWWSILFWTFLIIGVLFRPGPLPKLIMDPQDPTALFGDYSGYVYFAIQFVLPTGWINCVVEISLMPQVGWGLSGVLPLVGILVLHWRHGPFYWYQLAPRLRPYEATVPIAERPPTTSEVNSESNTSWSMRSLLTVSETRTARLPNFGLDSLVQLPSQGWNLFSERAAGVAERVFFPSLPGGSLTTDGELRNYRRSRQARWVIAVLLLVFLLVFARVKNAPQYDLLAVLGVIGLHASSILVPHWDRWGTSQQWLPLIMYFPVHADWLLAWWLRRSVAWCAVWMVVLGTTWMPLLQWFDRLPMVDAWQRLLVVILAMNVGIAGVACARSLPWWNELNARLRSGYYDLRLATFAREIAVGFGFFGWAGLLCTLPVALSLPASVFIGLLVLCISWSWGLLFLLRKLLLYPTQKST